MFIRILLMLSIILSVACEGLNKRLEREDNKKEAATNTEDYEVSLAKDRSQYSELRQDIPAQKQKENDELAFVLNMLREDKPININSVRSRWNREIRKRRKNFNRDTKKARDEFNKKQKKARESFLAKQKSERNSFNRSSKSREDSKDFYADQDQIRRSFFADQRDRSNAFRDEQREKRRAFDEVIRGRVKEFNDLYREYQRRQRDRKTALRLEKRMQQKQKKIIRNNQRMGLSPEDQKALNDFNKIPPGLGTLLSPQTGR